MNILVLNANPRKTGHTQNCTDLFVNGLCIGSNNVKRIDLVESDIKQCKGCFHCWSIKPGTCVIDDSMRELIQHWLTTDILVFISPLYAYSVSSYLKIFMERTLPLLAPEVVSTVSGIDRNCQRFPGKGPKILAALIVGGLKSPTLSNGAVESLRLYAEGFGMKFGGAILRHESFVTQFSNSKPLIIKEIEQAIVRAGISLAETGQIPQECQKIVSQPISQDLATFAEYSTVYWEYGSDYSFHKGDMENVKNATNRDIRILMREMTRGFNPGSTGLSKLVISYVFHEPELQYTQIIDNGTCTLVKEKLDHFDLSIECCASVWVSIIYQEVNTLDLLSRNEIRISGDRKLFTRLGRIFSPPSR